MSDNIRICYITAIYGNYEGICKEYKEQTIKSDFICFTDNKYILSNGWEIDTTPYHEINKSEIDNNEFINSLSNNKHTFNIAKYYKQSFYCIPRLKKYEVVIWLDGTIEIISEYVSEYILSNIKLYKIITWNHEYRMGMLYNEVVASNFYRYTSTRWNNQEQPYQDIYRQYDEYRRDGYDEMYFKRINSDNLHFGVWLTCFIAFLNNDPEVINFLELWYLQTLKYTTQDQIGFSYVCQKTKLIPYTLPDKIIKGENPHFSTMFYKKHNHGK